MAILNDLSLTTWQFALVLLAAVLVGMARSGMAAISLLATPLLVYIYGGKGAIALVLLLMLVGDVFAVKEYRRHTLWTEIKSLLPSVIIGLLVGSIVGTAINDRQFVILVAIIILVSLGAIIFLNRKGAGAVIPHNRYFIVFTGLLSGFASMVGNASGPIFAVYLMAIGLKKQNYLGTSAWLFFIMNLIKLPIHVFAWYTIDIRLALLAVILIPAVYAGIRVGVAIIKVLHEKVFYYVLVSMTAISAIRLLISF